jgi:hypothetical protein
MPTTKAASGVFCDTCKDKWGWVKDETGKTVPHPKGRKQAYITTISETHYKEPVIRSLCYPCLDETSKWIDGSTWTLQAQIQYAKDNRNGQQLTIGSDTNGI